MGFASALSVAGNATGGKKVQQDRGRWNPAHASNNTPPPLVSKWLHIREEDDRAAYRTHREMEDVRVPVLIISVSGFARIVSVFLREYAMMGDREQYAPMGKVFFIGFGLSPLWWRAAASPFKNRPMHVLWSSIWSELMLLVATVWSVGWPEKGDPTMLLCIFLSGSWQISVLSPFLRLGVYLVMAVANVFLESQRPHGLRHATFLGPAILMYQMYWAEHSSRMSFVLQRHLWRSMSDRAAVAPPRDELRIATV